MTHSEAAWRTEAPPDYCADFGCPPLHVVFFQPADDRPGPASCVCVQVPEATRQQVRSALRNAAGMRARVVFICDTMEQADDIARRAAAALPQHRRVPFELAEAGQWGPLS